MTGFSLGVLSAAKPSGGAAFRFFRIFVTVSRFNHISVSEVEFSEDGGNTIMTPVMTSRNRPKPVVLSVGTAGEYPGNHALENAFNQDGSASAYLSNANETSQPIELDMGSPNYLPDQVRILCGTYIGNRGFRIEAANQSDFSDAIVLADYKGLNTGVHKIRLTYP